MASVSLARRARQAGENPVEAKANAVGGWVLFSGTIERTGRDDREAYLFGYGTHVLHGTGADAPLWPNRGLVEDWIHV